jgi:uncharacterized protein YdhG (YjbR/CyaY superfamily)
MAKASGKPGAEAVTAFIESTPVAVRPKLELVRRTIRSVVPDAVEGISYRMPAFRLPGAKHRRPFVWYALRSSYLGLYLRPPTIQNHRRDLTEYTTTKSAVHLPLDEPIPTGLLRKLLRAAAQTDRTRPTV